MSRYANDRSLRRLAAAGLVLILGAWLGALPGSGARAGDFAPVLPGRPLVFPADTGAHPAFRTEWWYITGWLIDEAGRERGFQVTFFRSATGVGQDNPSRFAPRQIIMAHAAIADAQTGHLLHAQRSDRALDPLAGAAVGRTRAWIGDWELALADGEYRARIAADEFGLDLALLPPGPPVLNGEAGFSQKTPDPRNASYYYSRPHLAVRGTLRLGEHAHRVTGEAWLDQEWSSEYLPEEAEGWDWIGMNLHDGGSLMAFQMRRPDGSPIWSAGTLRDGDGQVEALAPEQVRFRPRRRWTSPRTGAEYVVEWDLEIAGRSMALVPLMDDQELDSRRSTGVVYWEGATRLFEAGREIGRGYLEMTGYRERPAGL
ncbi:lipocalin-like domain-containing protein [Thiococcus pfennigii]|jgi:predicted secreted hydrolase|uniref:lipocalin-like domain-containing protein n=1 Tax=Thiococcus pfennigii TaxID=1057 RepID=UPI001902FEF6|nr:carotenoid 1,2-hydratase [Thiococcus pfennigii]MBK1701550.1 carotenoid 1,2-hydratase [Thiococcus pfennigii]MBK1731673.1 carotenoid 1,2-hydratase [Thiococcus pfennigii]